MMPGLAVIIGRGSSSSLRQVLAAMLGAMSRNPSATSGTAVDEALGVYAGWTSLEGAPADSVAVADGRGERTLFFLGEHHGPAPTTRAGGPDRPPRDPSGLLDLYEREGERFVSRLNGFFHGLIIDQIRKRALLFNDRFGMQRLYYVEEKEAVLIASEAKALLAVHPPSRAFDKTGLSEWISCGAVLENRSLFEGIKTLPGASLWTVEPGGGVVKRTYFSPSTWESAERLPLPRFYDRLRTTLADTLPSYIPQQGDVGIATTAGLDTRILLANAKPGDASFRCYTFCGPYRESLDARIGRQVAQALGYPHTSIVIGPDLFADFGAYAEEAILMTDGNLDLSGGPNLYVNQISRQISPVRITGNYGSEILRRHIAFGPSLSACPYLAPDYAGLVKAASDRWRGYRDHHRLTFVAFMMLPWYCYNRLQLEQGTLTMRSPFADNAVLEALYAAPDEATASPLISLRLIADGSAPLARIHTDRGLAFPRNPAGLFLRAYYEFIFKMEYYASHGMPKSAAAVDRRLGRFSLEKVFIGRNKYYHFRQWFRDELAGFVREIALDESTLRQEHLNRKTVEKAVLAHLAGNENHTHFINTLITLELTRRLIMRNPPT